MNAFISWLVAVVNVQLFDAIWAYGIPETNEQKLEILDQVIANLQNQYEILKDEPDKIA
jgi:hypothetical protein